MPQTTRHSRRFDPPPTTSGKQTFSAATPTGCKRFERGAGAVYKKRAGVFSRHHDDTMMRDENRVKKCEKYLILLNKLAGVVQWQNGSFPSCIRGFDSLRPLQPCASVRRKARLPRITGAIAFASVRRLAGPDREIR